MTDKIDLHDVVLVPIKSLKKDPTNPNVMNERQMNGLRSSMKRFGYLQPVIVDSNTMMVADGEHRLIVYEETGRTEVPCILLDLKDDAEPRLLRQTMNKLRGAHDQEKDLDELQFLIRASRTGELVLLTGIDSNKLLEFVQMKRPDGRELALPKVLETKTQRGEKFQLGRHLLLCGDSTNPEDMARLQAGRQIDQVQIDPPYGVSYGQKNEFLNAISPGNRIQTPIENDQQEINGRDLLISVFGLVNWADYNTVYCWAPSGAQLYDLEGGFLDAGLKIGINLVWVKNNIILGRKDYNAQHENIIYGWNGKHKFYGERKSTIIRYNKPQVSKLHPTMKPTEIISQFIADGSPQSGIVLDCFGGSGSTLIACERINRTCLMMELDPHYCDVIISRWETQTGRKAKLV